MDDEQAYEFYSDPKNLEPGGPGRRRKAGRSVLTSHVPVRFPPATIAAVKSLAEADGVTVSTWIRQVVQKEVERRQPPIQFSTGLPSFQADRDILVSTAGTKPEEPPENTALTG
jgi:hypothetical protein